MDDLSLMFGYLNQNHDWVDGVFTNVWRKANRVGDGERQAEEKGQKNDA